MTTMHAPSRSALAVYGFVGMLFGIVLTKSEAISWFRIQEMFRFQSFHMFGLLFAAIVVAATGVQLVRRSGIKTVTGTTIVIPPKAMGSGTRYWLGGTLFGLGWALVGACPGPMLILIGNGVGVMIVAVMSGLVGTWCYGVLRRRLPH
jgi:uncharacterized protein